MKSKFFSDKAISASLGLLLLRIVSGGTMMTHGLSKLQNVLSGNTAFADPIGIGALPSLYLTIFAEGLCAALIVLGLVTRIALIPPIVTMLVAFFIVHGADAFNIRELSFLFLGMFVTLFFTGPGKFSIDNRIK